MMRRLEQANGTALLSPVGRASEVRRAWVQFKRSAQVIELVIAAPEGRGSENGTGRWRPAPETREPGRRMQVEREEVGR